MTSDSRPATVPTSVPSPTAEPTDGTRQYHSPRREAQANETRRHILETMADMLATGRGDNLSVKRLAAEAGVSERTVYRYFPDRAQLLNGLSELLDDVMGNREQEAELATLDELADFLGDVYRGFEAQADITKSAFLINPDPAKRTDLQRARTERMIAIAAKTFPDLAEPDQRRLGQLTRVMTSTYGWLQCREEFGFDADETAELIGWALNCVLAEVHSTGQVGGSN